MLNYSAFLNQISPVPMRLVPLSLVVSRTFVSLPFLTGVACAVAAVLVDASTTTYRTIHRKKTANKKKEDSRGYLK